jgi:hypothetical protein
MFETIETVSEQIPISRKQEKVQCESWTFLCSANECHIMFGVEMTLLQENVDKKHSSVFSFIRSSPKLGH